MKARFFVQVLIKEKKCLSVAKSTFRSEEFVVERVIEGDGELLLHELGVIVDQQQEHEASVSQEGEGLARETERAPTGSQMPEYLEEY